MSQTSSADERARLRVNAIQSPVGDQAGMVSRSGLVVTRRLPLPSAFIVQMSNSSTPACQLSYAMRVPSGDHDARLSPQSRVPRLLTPLPSIAIVKTSGSPARSLQNAIRWRATAARRESIIDRPELHLRRPEGSHWSRKKQH